jgi:hypothetical protein
VEQEEEVDADHKSPHILLSEVEKAIKEMNKKAAGDDVPVGAQKSLGEDGLNLMTQLINNMYKSAEWTKDSLRLQ